MIKNFFTDLVKAYGALYLANGGLSSILLFAATMVQPMQGLIGLIGGTSALLFRRGLKTPEPPYNIDVMNAVFVSLALAKVFEPSLRLIALVILASCITILLGRLIQNTLRDHAGLPVLSLPFVLMSWLILPASSVFGLTHLSYVGPILPISTGENMLQAFGALYFNPDCLAGGMVLLGFLLLSPVLCCLGILGYAVAQLVLLIVTNNVSPSIHLVAGYNGIVTSMVIGGILGIPRKQHIMITIFAVTVSTFLSITASAILAVFWLPVFSSPFIIASYLTLLVFRGVKAPDWARYWQPIAALPESSLDRLEQHEIRGLSKQSLGLYTPFRGAWDVYQGFNGAHTHQGLWRHGVDFFKMVNGSSFACDGLHLSDYYCYGEDICSPVFGHVVTYRDDVEDNLPGDVNIGDNWGNYIIISVSGGFYVVMAHLQKNSIKVSNGSFVSPGITVGKCGNSGRSFQPHLHLQVQKSANLGDATIPYHLIHVFLETEQGLEFSLNLIPREQQRISQAIVGTNIKEALKIQVGKILTFIVNEDGKVSTWNLNSSINLIGQLTLKTDRNAHIILHSTEFVLALDNRFGPRDSVFDALLLSIGLTPYSEEPISWQDSQPINLMPLPILHRTLIHLMCPFGGGLKSRYQRHWSHEKKRWLQHGVHSIHAFGITLAEVITEAEICEGTGLIAFRMLYRGKEKIKAELSGIGQRGDLGIPKIDTSIDLSEQIPKRNNNTMFIELY